MTDREYWELQPHYDACNLFEWLRYGERIKAAVPGTIKGYSKEFGADGRVPYLKEIDEIMNELWFSEAIKQLYKLIDLILDTYKED